MTDKKKKTDRASPEFLDALTGRIVKIGALLGACAAVITTAVTFRTELGKLIHPSAPASLTDCFKPLMIYPPTIAVGGWESMDLRMTGRNDCQETLAVYVAFKVRQADTVQIEAPFKGDPDCQAGGPGCWERFSPAPGDLTRRIIPPRLTLLKRPLGRPVPIYINWIIYAAETGKQIRADTGTIVLVDDPQPHAMSVPRGIEAGAAAAEANTLN